jgi:4-diphosphocytidyl-2-C-methyl-D-erythritol kinase
VSAAKARAKINLALVVGPRRDDGKHEVVTVLQHIELADRIAVARGDRFAVSGFDDDTIVASALRALGVAAQVEPSFAVEISKDIPVAAGLGGGSSDAATALLRANELLPTPLDRLQLEEIAVAIGADVPFFLRTGPHLGTGDGSTLTPLAIPQDFWIVLLLPDGVTKSSTGDVYGAFDARNGADGFDERRAVLLEAVDGIREREGLRNLPANDLAASPHAERLSAHGAFRADVSGAGPCVYGLFSSRQAADEAATALRSAGRTWVTAPARW